jgi:hypothetical protein
MRALRIGADSGVFVVIKHGRRRLAHVNVTTNPTAEWTLPPTGI